MTFLRFVRFFTIFFFRNVCLLALTFCFQKDFPKAARLSGLPFFGFFIREIRGYLDCTITFINYFHYSVYFFSYLESYGSF